MTISGITGHAHDAPRHRRRLRVGGVVLDRREELVEQRYDRRKRSPHRLSRHDGRQRSSYRQSAASVIVVASRRLSPDGCGWFSGWRRADSRVPCRRLGLTAGDQQHPTTRPDP
jgi:hypothetical protein